MQNVKGSQRGRWTLHRCPVCTAEYREKLAKAKACFRPGAHNRKRQIVFPPVIMSERWP